VSVLCEICEFGASGVEVLEVSLQGGNVFKPSSFLRCYATRLLSCVDIHSFSFNYALNLV
jgi:hypothetical protein